MPELPEVETVRRTLLEVIKNNKIIDVDIRYPNIIQTDLTEFQKTVKNQNIHHIDRKGKFLIIILDTHVMIIHLRMEGKFFIKQNESISKHEHIIFKLSDGTDLRYHDVRKFGTIHLLPIDQYQKMLPLSKVAEEPKDIQFIDFYQRIKHREINIKQALLNQEIIAGLGNIYVDETLFLSRIHPMRKTNQISEEEAKIIIESARNVLDKAVQLGGTTIRSYTSSLGVHGRFQNELQVHMKKDEPCPICGHPIIKMKVGGRGTYVCPECQS